MCRQLFEKHDKNQDGRIDVEEFRSLMKLLGDEVHGDTISMMFEAMDIHGSLDFEEFLTILEVNSSKHALSLNLISGGSSSFSYG